MRGAAVSVTSPGLARSKARALGIKKKADQMRITAWLAKAISSQKRTISSDHATAREAISNSSNRICAGIQKRLRETPPRSGRIISAMQDAGFEVRHEENLREHYAMTCAAWCDNLVAHWEDAVGEAGEATSKVWGLYLAGSRLGFERNQVQLHQVLGVKLHSDGRADFPLHPDWGC